MCKRRIKVAIVSQSMNIGGGEIMAAKLAGYIDNKEFDVKLFVIAKEQDNYIKTVINESKIEYVCLDLPTKFDVKSYKTFSGELKKFAPDVVHVNLDHCYSWIWCILNNCPLVATMHSDPYRRKSSRVGMMMKIKAAQGNLKIIGCSQKTAELVKSCYKLPDKYVSYIYNPIDLEKFKYSQHNGKEFNFVNIGRFHPVKNHEMLVEAFAQAFLGEMSVKLHLAGDGELKDAIENKVIELGIDKQVIFHGNVENIPRLLEYMDVLVVPSKSEAFPMVILEGMASGLPVIATEVGGIPEIINDNGILVPNDSMTDLAEAMVKIKNNTELCEYYSKMSLTNIKKYDKKIISDAYENEYRLLGEKYANK